MLLKQKFLRSIWKIVNSLDNPAAGTNFDADWRIVAGGQRKLAYLLVRNIEILMAGPFRAERILRHP